MIDVSFPIHGQTLVLVCKNTGAGLLFEESDLKDTNSFEQFEKVAEEKCYPSMGLFIQEDKGICEVVHRGVVGQLTQPGRYCPPQQKTVYGFANTVLDRVVGPAQQ